MMKAILSCTADDLYSFNLPFAVYSWYKMGIDCVVFMPVDSDSPGDGRHLRLGFAAGMCGNIAPKTIIHRLQAPYDKVATYAQCARLYAAAIAGLDPTDVLVTSDADMCVFNAAYWQQFDYNGAVNIVGADLVPDGQVPMCYIAAPLVGWRNFMQIDGRSVQQCLDDLLGPIQAENFRGNYWAKDQETAFKSLQVLPFPIVRHLRAAEGTQFATRRADRDGWQVNKDIIDAHLPRPGYTEDNFYNIYALFKEMYPSDDLAWMEKYWDEWLELMKQYLSK